MRRSKLMKIFSLVLAVAMLSTVFAGCGKKSDNSGNTSTNSSTGKSSTTSATDNGTKGTESSTEESGKTKVVVGLASDPQNIGPFQGMSQGRIGILFTLYEFLAVTDGGEMKGVLMKGYEKVDDLTYNVEIYDYIYDQAGNHLTASDVAFCYNTAKELGNLPKLGAIDSVEPLSDYIVQFKFNNLAIGDLGALLMECPIVTQAAYEASSEKMATMPVTTSPYKCVEYVSGSKIVFEKTNNYWQTDTSKIQKTSMSNVDIIEFDVIPDQSQLTNALKTKAIDVTNWLSDTDVDEFRGLSDYGVSPIPDNTTYFLLFNCDESNGVFRNNLKFRQAIAYAINKQQIVDGAFNGNGNVAKTWGNTNYSDYVDKWLQEDYYEYDIEKAKQLLAESGVSNPTLNLMITSGDVNTKIATIIQAQLQQIGVNVNINAYDNQLANEYKYKPEQWDILLDQGGSTSYLVNVWKLAWDRTGYVHGGAENFVKDDKLQSLLEAAMNPDKHNDETMDAFHQYLKEQCYGIGLVQPMSNIAHTSNIKEIVVDARGQVIPGACNYTK